jgi:hypothetical protein
MSEGRREAANLAGVVVGLALFVTGTLASRHGAPAMILGAIMALCANARMTGPARMPERPWWRLSE